MHFRVLLVVDLLEPLRGPGSDGDAVFTSYAQSLGVNAPDIAQAAALAQEYVLARDPAVAAITSAHLDVLAYSEIPSHVMEGASRPVDHIGVYWASGRIFIRDEDEDLNGESNAS